MSALEAAAVRRVSYFSLVWRELRRDRLAVFGIRAVVVLVVLAVGAPLLSSNQPFWYHDAHGWSSPWFDGLFDRLVFESSVDIFFNQLLVLIPPFLLVCGVYARIDGESFQRRRGRLLALFGALFLLQFLARMPATVGGAENPWHYSHAVQNYRAKLAADRSASALFPLHHYGYRETNPSESLSPPSAEHWLGTDQEGRDVFARMLYGTRISLSIGVVAVALYVSIGVVVGALAGYFGGWVDTSLSRLIEVMICFPTFFLILTLAALIRERSIFHVMLIIGVTSWTGVARLVRAEFLKHKGLEYAQAARALGIPVRRIIFRHILPNASAPVLVSATFGIASSILVESSLSFLGIGDPNVASWGETLNAGRIDQRLWLILAPGFAIFFVVTVFNLVGEGLRDALDPKLRK
jgi:peptide/nickel transport system permease protein